jgi:hypothetical protein
LGGVSVLETQASPSSTVAPWGEVG